MATKKKISTGKKPKPKDKRKSVSTKKPNEAVKRSRRPLPKAKTTGKDPRQLVLAFPGDATPMGLLFDKHVSYQVWSPVGKKLRHLNDWIKFSLGDWMNHGELAFGEQYAQGVDETGMTPETITHLKHIADVVPESIRRIDVLHYGHHVNVAPKKYDREAKIMWLNKAIDNNWGVRKMHEEMNPKAAEEEADEAETPESGCSCCGASPAPEKVCGSCSAVAAKAVETMGVKAAMALMGGKLSKSQASLLGWAFEHIKEPNHQTGAEAEAWGERFKALQKAVSKAA